jgi:hypothetical protein
VARDATARQFDVDADAVRLDLAKGEITFRAKKGRLVDLDKLHESIWATRLSGNTGMALNWIDVTVAGEVAVEKDHLVVKVAGSDTSFVLKEDPKARADGKTPFTLLREAAQRGQKRVMVTGRVVDWHGHFPPFLKSLPKKPRVILVKDFVPVKAAPPGERSTKP